MVTVMVMEVLVAVEVAILPPMVVASSLCHKPRRRRGQVDGRCLMQYHSKSKRVYARRWPPDWPHTTRRRATPSLALPPATKYCLPHEPRLGFAWISRVAPKTM